jgi:hypothetical protein
LAKAEEADRIENADFYYLCELAGQQCAEAIKEAAKAGTTHVNFSMEDWMRRPPWLKLDPEEPCFCGAPTPCPLIKSYYLASRRHVLYEPTDRCFRWCRGSLRFDFDEYKKNEEDKAWCMTCGDLYAWSEDKEEDLYDSDGEVVIQ